MRSAPIVSKIFLFPFILVTSLFFLWGFPNDLTNPMVEVFKNVLNISNVKAAYVQLAFYGGLPPWRYQQPCSLENSVINLVSY